MKTKKMAIYAMFAALVCAATLISIPSPLGGYWNAGDGVILLSAFLLGPVGGAFAGGVGAGLADLILGYALYAPATLVIKALMGVAAALLFRAIKVKFLRLAVPAVVGECIMMLGYFLFEVVLYGIAPALEAMITTNLPQAAVGVVIAVVLYVVLDKAKLARKIEAIR